MKKSIIFILAVAISLSLILGACTAPVAKEAPADKAGYPTEQDAAPSEDKGYPAAPQEAVIQPEAGYPAGGIVRIATDATFPPFEMVDEATKELIGFDIELMDAVAKQAGLQYEFVNLPFDPMLAGLSECQYDIAIAAITITDERKEQFLFSDPYIDAGQIITVKSGNTDIKSKDDLNGKIVGAQLGTTGEIEAKAIEGLEYKPYDTYDLAFLDLMNGQIDAVIADYPTALGFIAKNPEKLITVGEVFTNEFYGIAFCKNRQDLLNIVNPALKTVIDSGFVKELAGKYLTGE
jgi:polar amino acid transport system substrate-binding protein